jgi:hypothetical protein
LDHFPSGVITDDRMSAINVHDVLAVRIAQSTEEPRHFVVLLGFFGQHFYAVEVVPHDQTHRAFRPTRAMTWPRAT